MGTPLRRDAGEEDAAPGAHSSACANNSHANTHACLVTFEELWAEAVGQPGRPAIGLIRDSWAGLVGCAIQFDGETGAVVLDFPADRLLSVIRDYAGEEGWFVARQEAHPAGDHRHALRYIMALSRKTPVHHD